MILLAVVILLLGASPIFYMGVKAVLDDKYLQKHQRCLESIRRLEPELFPDLWPEWRWVEWEPAEEYKWEQAHPLYGPMWPEWSEQSSISAADYALEPGVVWHTPRTNMTTVTTGYVADWNQARNDFVSGVRPDATLEAMFNRALKEIESQEMF